MKMGRVAAGMTENLIERFILSLSLCMRPALFSLEARFLGRFGGSSWSSLLRNYQRTANEIRQLLFREIAVSALAPHLAGNYANAPIGCQSRGKPVEQAGALVF